MVQATIATVSQAAVALVAVIGLAGGAVHYVAAQTADVKTVKENVASIEARVTNIEARVTKIEATQLEMLGILKALAEKGGVSVNPS